MTTSFPPRQPAASSGLAVGGDWFDAQKAIFVDRTGLNPLQFSSSLEDFNDWQTWKNGVLVTGDSSGVVVPGNVGSHARLKSVNPENTGLTGKQEWFFGATGTAIADQIQHVQFRRWMIAGRFGLTNMFQSVEALLGLAFNNHAGLYCGIGSLGTLASPGHWFYTRSGVNVLDLGVGITPCDETVGLIDCYMGNFDFVNVMVNYAAADATKEVVGEPVLSLPAAGGRPYLRMNVYAPAIIKADLICDKIACFWEL